MAPMDGDSTPSKPLGFFDLPTELRDLIYDLLPRCARILRKKNLEAYTLSYRDRPAPGLMHINKQFTLEYATSASAQGKHHHLYIEDNRYHPPSLLPGLSPEATLATALTCDLCCLQEDTALELAGHVRMVQNFVEKAGNCFRIRLRICFESRNEVRQLSLEEVFFIYGDDLERLERVKGLEWIEVYVHAKGLAQAVDWTERSKLVMRYRAAGGGWEVVGDGE